MKNLILLALISLSAFSQDKEKELFKGSERYKACVKIQDEVSKLFAKADLLTLQADTLKNEAEKKYQNQEITKDQYGRKLLASALKLIEASDLRKTAQERMPELDCIKKLTVNDFPEARIDLKQLEQALNGSEVEIDLDSLKINH